MRVFITGVAGFLGSHLADAHVARGDEVFGIDNLITGDADNVPREMLFGEKDIRSSEIDLTGYDVVYHMAAIARTMWTVEDPGLCFDVNIAGTFNLLEIAKECQVPRFVTASSAILYVPYTPYFVSKQAAESMTLVYHHMYGMSTVALRYANIYGSLRQSEKGDECNVMAAFNKARRLNGKVVVEGTGKQTRDFIHVEDAVEATILAGQSDYCGYLDICTGIQTPIIDVAQRFAVPIEYADPRPFDAQELRQDPKPAENAIGFRSKIAVEDGMKCYTEQ